MTFKKDIKEIEYDKEGVDIINKLMKDEDALMTVAMWMTAKGHHKRYKVCNAHASEECIGIGLASKFHGKHCPACVREYRREWYDKENPEVVRRRKSRTTSGKRSPKRGKDSKRTVSFKKGTKK